MDKFSGGTNEIPEITDITLIPAPTITYLNPRPSDDSPSYPWRWDGSHDHVIKLPVPLTFLDLGRGSQIVVTGVTEQPEVIEGVIEDGFIVFRASGLVIARVGAYEGETDLITVYVMEDFTGEILAVNFDEAFRNLPELAGLSSDDGHTSYFDISMNVIANLTINKVCPALREIPFMPSPIENVNNIVLGTANLVTGNVIEGYLYCNDRSLYIITHYESFKLNVTQNNMNLNSPLQLPEL